MAEFSNEYCERYLDFPGTFSIEEEFEKLPIDNYKELICEGYGFHGIFKSDTGEKWCYFWGQNDEIVGVTYKSLAKNTAMLIAKGKL